MSLTNSSTSLETSGITKCDMCSSEIKQNHENIELRYPVAFGCCPYTVCLPCSIHWKEARVAQGLDVYCPHCRQLPKFVTQEVRPSEQEELRRRDEEIENLLGQVGEKDIMISSLSDEVKMRSEERDNAIKNQKKAERIKEQAINNFETRLALIETDLRKSSEEVEALRSTKETLEHSLYIAEKMTMSLKRKINRITLENLQNGDEKEHWEYVGFFHQYMDEMASGEWKTYGSPVKYIEATLVKLIKVEQGTGLTPKYSDSEFRARFTEFAELYFGIKEGKPTDAENENSSEVIKRIIKWMNRWFYPSTISQVIQGFIKLRLEQTKSLLGRHGTHFYLYPVLQWLRSTKARCYEMIEFQLRETFDMSTVDVHEGTTENNDCEIVQVVNGASKKQRFN